MVDEYVDEVFFFSSQETCDPEFHSAANLLIVRMRSHVMNL